MPPPSQPAINGPITLFSPKLIKSDGIFRNTSNHLKLYKIIFLTGSWAYNSVYERAESPFKDNFKCVARAQFSS